MDLSDAELRSLIRRASDGDGDALGQLLEHFRPKLKALAQDVVRRGLQGRLNESDIVQQTCASAIRNREGFQGREPGEFEAWLRTVHERNLKNVLRDHVAYGKRDVRREAGGAQGTEQLAALENSPSGVVVLQERQERVLQAIQALPADQQMAVRLRHLEGLGLAEIAERMQRSPSATAGLLKRGVAALKLDLHDLLNPDA